MKKILNFSGFVNENYQINEGSVNEANNVKLIVKPTQGTKLYDLMNALNTNNNYIASSNVKKNYIEFKEVKDNTGLRKFIETTLRKEDLSLSAVIEVVHESAVNESGRLYTGKEKQKLIENWDRLFIALKIEDENDQDVIVKAFDKMDGDGYSGSMIEIVSDALDTANLVFSYDKLTSFINSYVNESISIN